MKPQLHPRLEGALRVIDPTFPVGVESPREAWPIIRPPGKYLRGSFWYALSGCLPFAQTPGRQVEIADWILNQKKRIEAQGRQWPPAPICTSQRALSPQPIRV